MRSFSRPNQSSRLRRQRDDGIHVRKNGDLYLVYNDKRARPELGRRAAKPQD